MLSGLIFIGRVPFWTVCWSTSQGVTYVPHEVGPSLPSRPDTPYQENDEDEHHSGGGVFLPFTLGVDQCHKDESDEERGDPVRQNREQSQMVGRERSVAVGDGLTPREVRNTEGCIV